MSIDKFKVILTIIMHWVIWALLVITYNFFRWKNEKLSIIIARLILWVIGSYIGFLAIWGNHDDYNLYLIMIAILTPDIMSYITSKRFKDALHDMIHNLLQNISNYGKRKS